MKLALGVTLAFAFLIAAPLSCNAAPRRGDDTKPADDKEKDKTKLKADTFTGLELRGIGPALTSGRIIDIVVAPNDRFTWYVAAASGGVWKTTNAGTTWSPIFDSQGSYSIGCLAIDPKNPLVVWVGSGENNSQRSVAYGDGVYKSTDGGNSWENVGLKASEHIGKIAIDPRDSNVVWVAAQGPLWASGGDRGLYKTTDGGKSWKKVLEISDDTGVTDVVLDPRNPDVVFASAYQRRRHVWTLIDGGPECGIHKSTDGGATWKKLDGGLPKEEMGRIGLAISPVDPDVVYATIEAANKAGGFFRSTDSGAKFEKMSDTVSGGPQYYQELFPDPKVAGRVYQVDVYIQVTEDGGKTFRRLGEKFKHVDNHAIWIDPADTDHLLVGCDGGLYETFDRAASWRFVANLPITQFYKVCVDEAAPFYNVYGGTQDNFSLGGPVRTRTAHGITNQDWFVTQGGDGFQCQVDPEDPNVVYAEAQHGVLARFDRRSGEQVDIQPQPGADGAPLRWNWDSPLIISPHSHTRLYFAANRVFRSDDRGDSWQPISADLTRQIDRNQLKVMGRVWSVDSVAKNTSTSFYGNIVALAESPLREGRIAIGTDDGLVQITEDGGKNWRKIETFPGVPDRSYVSRVVFSPQDADVMYATFDNHKMGDFKPYVLKSTDAGATWTSIAGDLPERGTVYCLLEDPGKRELLFAGTEFGLFFTPDAGAHWIQLKGKMPIIQVRDIAIQKREGDLVAATFGRGFYVLDDYTPLRTVSTESLDREAALYPVKDAWLYVPSTPLGLRDKAFQGTAFYTAPNPPFGAVFTYYLKDEIETAKKKRQKAEKELIKTKGDVTYPTWDALRAEDREEEPSIVLSVMDPSGFVVRRLTGPATAGFHRVAWDLRQPATTPPTLAAPSDDDPFASQAGGPLVSPGTYRVALAKRVGGKLMAIGNPVDFHVVPLDAKAPAVTDAASILAFREKAARLQRAVVGANRAVSETQDRLKLLAKAVQETRGAAPQLADDARDLDARLKDLQVALTGDSVVAGKSEPTPPAITERIGRVVEGTFVSTAAPTQTQRQDYDIAAAQFTGVLDKLRTLIEVDLRKLEAEAEAAGAPWTPGRVPQWKPE
ncbi:MAG: glycosyl hydrolase [Planctomycetes bacterium]|nr:glycosyl hydrolase [Planctomycetota bacterium]MBI3848330.1 glycosyl hydrolase [Planctomycetota bacterium]